MTVSICTPSAHMCVCVCVCDLCVRKLIWVCQKREPSPQNRQCSSDFAFPPPPTRSSVYVCAQSIYDCMDMSLRAWTWSFAVGSARAGSQ